MKPRTLQIPAPHVIEEIQKRRNPPDERIPLQLPLPMPNFPEPEPKREERVITIQL